MCKCTPGIRTPFCGKPGCEWPKPIPDPKQKEYSDIYQALIIWRNYIETGDVNLSANFAIQCGKSEIIKQLTTEQKKKCIELEELANKYLLKGT